MSAAVEAWLRDLQGAVSAWRLYPPEHPRNVDTLARLVERVAELTREREDCSVFALDGRLVTDDGVLDTAVPLAQGVFARLNAEGFDRLTVSRGAGADVLARLVAQLADVDTSGSTRGRLASSRYVRFSRLRRSDAEDATLVPAAADDSSLEQVWQSVARGSLELDVLEALVLALSQALQTNRGSWIPLAALRSHDAYTVTHITNVATLAMALAEAMGLNAPFVHDVGTAALLHDVGKLLVPAEILQSPQRLTDAQLAIMKRHPDDGARLLLTAPGVPDLAVMVAFEHHLHHNGGGYPAVPAGWRIHPGSAIVHVADVFDALRSDRPYRKGLDGDVVARMMLADAGTVFDPAVLQVFFDRVAPRLTWVAPPPPAADEIEFAAALEPAAEATP
jgi:HD-GYP domain-containing protein (c-di-GMP phosphodiesterase class II)